MAQAMQWLRRACAAVAVLSAGLAGQAQAETLTFADGSAVSTSAALAYFQSQLADPCAGAPPSCAADPLVERTAHALGDDIDRIYLFVHDEIGVVPLFGVQKGARGALIDKWATPFDQTHLFVALARAAGYQAQYVLGTVTLSPTQMQEWLGASPSALSEVLADGGIPFDAAGGNYTILHLWARVNVGGTWYAFDPAIKRHTTRAGSLTTAALDAAMGFSDSGYVSSTLVDASTSTSDAPQVTNFNRDNARSSMQSYSVNLLNHVVANYANAETADVIGGRDIMSYADENGIQPSYPLQDNIQGPRQTTVANHSDSHTLTGAIPYSLRTRVTMTVTSSAGTDVHEWRLDEIYGQELVFIPLQLMPLPTQGPNTYRLHLNGQALGYNHVGVVGGAVIALNHPYAANSGAYLDRTTGVALTFFAGAQQIIIGGGRMTPDFGAYLEARSTHEDGYVTYQTPGVGDPEPGESTADIGAQRATKRRYAASFAAQFGAAIGMAQQLGSGTIVLHDLVVSAQTLPVIGGLGDTPASTLGTISVQGAFSANANSGAAADTRSLRRATAALGSVLEGSAVQQNLDSVYPVSTAMRFDWLGSAANPAQNNRTFYFANSANWSYVSGQILDDDFYGGSEIRGIAANYIGQGYTLIIPRGSDLGPGDETAQVCSAAAGPACTIPGPERGGAFVALSPTGVVHVITAQDQGALSGGGGTNDAEVNPSRIFSIPEDFLERQFGARAEAYNVDLGTGVLRYTPPPDLVVGEGPYPYSLSFQRSFDSTNVNDHSAQDPPALTVYDERMPDGWTSNFMAEARMQNEGQRAFGDQSPREATDTIAAIRVLLALSADQGSDLDTLKHQLGAMHALAWWSDQLSYNAVQIVHGADTRSYFQLASGAFHAPGDATQLELFGARVTWRKNHTAAVRWWYTGMCLRATGRDGSISYYGSWQTGFASCNTTPSAPNPSRNEKWMRFRQQVFLEGVVVSFDDSRLSNNLGRSITMTGAGYPYAAQWAVRDDSNTARSVNLEFGTAASPTRFSVTGTDGNIWRYDLWAGGSSWRVFAPSSSTAPIMTATFGEARGQVTTLADAAGNTARYWISSGRVGAMIDPLHPSSNAVASRSYFDERGRPRRAVNRLGYESRTDYDAHGRVTEVVNPEGGRERYDYNVTHDRTHTQRIARPGSGLADIHTYASYDALCGMPTSQTDANGNVTTYTLLPNRCLYSSMSQPAVDDGTTAAATLVNPVTGHTWNAYGQLLARTDPTGRLATNSYNPSTHYLQSVTVEAGAVDIVTSFGRNAQGDVTSVTDPRGYVHTGTYDLARRLTRYDGPSGTGAATEWHYNLDGLVDYVRASDGGANPNNWPTTSYTYWNTGRVKTMTDPDGGVTQYFYDALNRLDHVLDPVNRRSETEYDAEGQVLQELRGVGSADQITYATRAWTADGLLDWVEDANANRSDITYDGFDRVSRVTFPSRTTDHTPNPSDYEEYLYDANSNRTRVTLRSSETIGFRYDALNRQCFKDLPSLVSDPEDECGAEIAGAGAADVFYGYDLASRRVYARFPGSFAYDNLCNASFNGVDHCYDTPGRVSAETSYNRRLQFDYDPAGNRTRITYPTTAGASSLYVDYVYDPLNRVTAVRENGAVAGAGLLATYDYDPQSRRTGIERAGGQGRATTYEYSPGSRLTGLNHGAIDGSHNADWTYGYTAAGQVASRTLIAVYEWSVGAQDDDYEVNGLNQYTEVGAATFDYDDRGNLTDSSARRYCYDLENRLTGIANAGGNCVSSPNVMALAYDPLGRLSQTIAGSTTTQFLYDGDRLVAEYNGSAAVQRRYVHGPTVDEPLVWYEGASLSDPRWLIADRQGSVIATVDEGGDLVGSVYRYGPYGEPDTTNGWNGSRFRYTGQITLPEAQLYHYKARVYDPGLGRFLQTDPIGYQDDMNLYVYVSNDATNLSDPTGLGSSSDCGSRVNNRDAGASSCTAVGEVTATNTISGGARGSPQVRSAGNEARENSGASASAQPIGHVTGSDRRNRELADDINRFLDDEQGTLNLSMGIGEMEATRDGNNVTVQIRALGAEISGAGQLVDVPNRPVVRFTNLQFSSENALIESVPSTITLFATPADGPDRGRLVYRYDRDLIVVYNGMRLRRAAAGRYLDGR